MTINTSKLAPFELRKWQKVAIERSNRPYRGIFLEAAGGKGKTIASLAIAKFKKAKTILVLNNQLTILKGWQKAFQDMNFDKDVKIMCITGRKLQNLLKESKSGKFRVDLLIIDEWQNMSSDNLIKAYTKINAKYRIGLSATPMRKAGQNFYGLEKTLWGKANPNQVFNWRSTHGILVEDRFSYSKYKWTEFRNYDTYIKNLPNFMSMEEIDNIENAEVNNGYKIIRHQIKVQSQNPELIKLMSKYNIVTINGKSAMPKLHFGVNAFKRYLNSAQCEVDFPKIKPVNKPSHLLNKLKSMITTCPDPMLIITKSVQLANIIKDQNPQIGIWTGDKKENLDADIWVATQQTLGVGVDGLQHKFKHITVLDPVSPDSGEYDDYRQLLWRVTGSRQQHDVHLIEIIFKL
jgi:hypothetical protein